MSGSQSFDDIFAGPPLMAILRGLGVDRSVSVATTAWDLGIESVEIPLQSDEDESAIAEVARLAESRGAIVGAGTIISVDQVSRAIDAGARYLVSPGFDADLAREAQARGIPILPGVATPSDVQAAVAAGLDWLKAFPATWLGAGWLRHIRGPFPQVRFVATGGIDAGNIEEFLDAGARVVAVGSALEDPEQLPRLAELLRRRSEG